MAPPSPPGRRILPSPAPPGKRRVAPPIATEEVRTRPAFGARGTHNVPPWPRGKRIMALPQLPANRPPWDAGVTRFAITAMPTGVPANLGCRISYMCHNSHAYLRPTTPGCWIGDRVIHNGPKAIVLVTMWFIMALGPLYW